MPELPPWLTQQADPAGAFLRGAQTGGVLANMINQRKVTESRLRLDEQESQLRHLKMEEAIRERDQRIRGEIVMSEAVSQIEPLLREGKMQQAEQALLALGARQPAVLDTDSYPKYLERVHAAVVTENTRLQLEETARYHRDAEAGRNDRAALLADNRWEIAEAKRELANDPNSLVAQQRLTRALLQMESLQQGWERIGMARANLGIREDQNIRGAVKTEAQLAQEGFRSKVPLAPGAIRGSAPAPDAATADWLGPGAAPAPQSLLEPMARPLTTSTVTASQESLRNLENSHAAVGRALQSVETTPEAFGPLGMAREALEVARTALFPGQPAPITAARTTADVAAEDIIRGMKQDSQMSLFEKKQLDRTARITSMADTPDRAKAKLNVIAVGIAGKAIRDAKLLGQLVPAWARQTFDEKADLSVYDEGELADAIAAGYVSEARGLQEFRRRRQP